MRRFLRREEGSNLVETALAMLILLPILFGTIEFSLVFYVYHDVTDSARVAVRWAAVRGADSCTYTPHLTNCAATSDQITSYVRALPNPGLAPAAINVSTTWCKAATSTPAGSTIPTTTWTTCGTSYNSRGNQVKITVSYNFPVTIPYWRTVNFPISSNSSMVITQ